VPYRAQFSEGKDGTLAEVFFNAGKEGTALDIMGRECGAILSIALQHGTPLKTIRDALPKLATGKPAGPVGKALSEIEEIGARNASK
jgi:ribonucleoside-diphosphate reductase alpha chain